jgi:ribosomal protein S18 acetylase RimI-like enzyme
VGHRVVVRRRLDGWPRFTDLLGVLVGLDQERLIIRTEDGTEHVLRLDEVEAAKPIPPRPAKFSEIAALELVGDRAWPAPEQERLGGWRLRAAQGWTNRANSALPIGEAGMPVEAAVDHVRRWYQDRGLPPKITVPLPLRRDVATHLAGAGWFAQPPVLVQVTDLANLADVHPARTRFALENAPEIQQEPGSSWAPGAGVQLGLAPSEGFLAIVGARKASLPAVAHQVMLGVPRVRFAEIRDGDGTVQAIARGAVVDGWLHLALVEVVPAARRRGLARAAAAALAGWAATEQATRAFLQVEEANEAAVALYAKQGFRTHHTYVTYRLDA